MAVHRSDHDIRLGKDLDRDGRGNRCPDLGQCGWSVCSLVFATPYCSIILLRTCGDVSTGYNISNKGPCMVNMISNCSMLSKDIENCLKEQRTFSVISKPALFFLVS